METNETKRDGQKGAITVEAVIILPVYILVILFIINFLNISYTQLTIQQGLNNAGRMLAQYGYALDIAVGLENLNDTEVIDNTEGKVKEVFDSLMGEDTGLIPQIGRLFQSFSLEQLQSTVDSAMEIPDKVKSMAGAAKKINGKAIAHYLMASGTELGASMVVESMVEEYLDEMKVNRSLLAGERGQEIHYYVSLDKDENIVLIATYRYESPMFSLFTDGIDMRQVVVVHPWIGGETEGVRQGGSIWKK